MNIKKVGRRWGWSDVIDVFGQSCAFCGAIAGPKFFSADAVISCEIESTVEAEELGNIGAGTAAVDVFNECGVPIGIQLPEFSAGVTAISGKEDCVVDFGEVVGERILVAWDNINQLNGLCGLIKAIELMACCRAVSTEEENTIDIG